MKPMDRWVGLKCTERNKDLFDAWSSAWDEAARYLRDRRNPDWSLDTHDALIKKACDLEEIFVRKCNAE